MSNEKATILEVEGMTCPSCVRHVTSALSEVGGVGAVDVKFREGIVVVKHDQSQASVAHLIAALGDAGYPSKPRA